ncbi:alpha/beta hydrolase family protein [Streptomyces globisporus]|uniref:alpha/beta hydrolase family protein n=1 Tax=Streptomyces globisporus TaxID=1908 RepID=UPI0037F1EA6D
MRHTTAQHRPSHRFSFAFSPNGQWGTCLALTGHDRLVMELWQADARLPRLAWTGERAETTGTQPAPSSTGDVITARNAGDDHHLAVLAPGTGNTEVVVRIPTPPRVTGVRVIAGHTSGRPGLAIARHEGSFNSIWWVHAPDHRLVHIADVPGVLKGGVWLSHRDICLTRVMDNAGQAVVLNTGTGTLRECGPPVLGQSEQLVVWNATAGEGLALRGRRGETTLWWWNPHSSRPAERLNRLSGEVRPIAAAQNGTDFAVVHNKGARSQLLRCTPELDTDPTPVPVEDGAAHPSGAWPTTGLWFPQSTWDTPLRPVNARERSPRLATGARIVEVAGAAGPLEAVAAGPEPAAGGRVVLALHGGPESRWRMEHDVFLSRLASRGVGLLALNQRGSTGYGTEHEQAISHRWAVDDLEDVLHVARALRAKGTEIALYGISYGAFLALIAAAAEPDLWSCCLAVAPFSSAPALYDAAPPAVQRMIDRVGGRTEAKDRLGPRDVLRLASRITAPVRIVYGDTDPVIPVSHARALVDSLTATLPDFIYHEVLRGGHHPLIEQAGAYLVEPCAQFLSEGTRPQTPHEERR